MRKHLYSLSLLLPPPSPSANKSIKFKQRIIKWSRALTRCEKLQSRYNDKSKTHKMLYNTRALHIAHILIAYTITHGTAQNPQDILRVSRSHTRDITPVRDILYIYIYIVAQFIPEIHCYFTQVVYFCPRAHE